MNEPVSLANDANDANDWTGSLVATVESPFAAAGPLTGMSYVVKDLIDLAGSPTNAGNPEFNRWRGTPVHTSAIISRLARAGARLVGKAHLHELAYGITGVNPHYGTPRNPLDESAIPGGSSSGSAVAVAAKLADFSIGTDTAGSVRVPAACCGLFSLRPTWGAIDSDGVVPLAPSFDTVGVFARDPSTLRTVCRELLSPDTSPRRWQQAVMLADALRLADEEGQRGALETAGALVQLGIPVREVPFHLLDEVRETLRVLQGNEAWRSYGQWIEEADPYTGEDVNRLLQVAEAITEIEVTRAERESRQLVREIEGMLAGHKLMVLPTIPGAPPHIGDLAKPEVAMAFRVGVMKLVALASLAGLPVVTIPVAAGENAPPGSSQLIGPKGSDLALLDLAAELVAAGPTRPEAR